MYVADRLGRQRGGGAGKIERRLLAVKHEAVDADIAAAYRYLADQIAVMSFQQLVMDHPGVKDKAFIHQMPALSVHAFHADDRFGIHVEVVNNHLVSLSPAGARIIPGIQTRISRTVFQKAVLFSGIRSDSSHYDQIEKLKDCAP